MVNIISLNKKKRMEDRISHLPDVLLHHILSSLNTKHVVQTCVLSKRWKTLWTDIPSLNFDYESYPSSLQGESKEKSFKYFVIRVLSQHRSMNIQKLRYNSSMNKDEVFLVELLVCYAGGHNVQQLCINTNDIGVYDWKYCLSTCSSSLTVLKMVCKFDDNWGALTLPSLKILEIECYYDEGDNGDAYRGIGTNFSCCPNLVSLVLIDYLWKNATICCPKLENLEVCATFDSHLATVRLEVLAPILKSVKFSNILPTIKFGSEFPCLEKVNIELDDGYFERKTDPHITKLTLKFMAMLKVFDNASSFTLPLKATQVISVLPFRSIGLSFRNMRELRLIKTDKTDDILLAYLLERLLGLKRFAVINKAYKKRSAWD